MNVLGRAENARLHIGHSVSVGGLIGSVVEDRQTELILIPVPEVAGSEGDAACRSLLNRRARSCSGQGRSAVCTDHDSQDVPKNVPAGGCHRNSLSFIRGIELRREPLLQLSLSNRISVSYAHG